MCIGVRPTRIVRATNAHRHRRIALVARGDSAALSRRSLPAIFEIRDVLHPREQLKSEAHRAPAERGHREDGGRVGHVSPAAAQRG